MQCGQGRATKTDDTELACDWINFDNGAETGLLRVKWSGTLAASGTQTLRVYPPVEANDSVAVGALFGSRNTYDAYWQGYWPLAADFNDRTSRVNHASATGSPTAGGISGHFGNATSFDGSTQYLKAIGPTSKPLTYMAWYYQDSNSSRAVLQQNDGTSSTDRWGLSTGAGGAGARIEARESDGTADASNSLYVVTEVWRHAVAVFKNATSRTSYLDSTPSTENTTSISATPDNDIGIGVGLGW